MAKRTKYFFQDGAPMTPRDVTTGSSWGYTCLIGQLHHGTTWMPKRYQADATSALKLLNSELKKKTKAQLVTFINKRRGSKGIPARHGEKKNDLVMRAAQTQYSRLYPHQSCKRSDR